MRCNSLNRSCETIVLDLSIALEVHDDVWADGSKVHLGQPEAFQDLFEGWGLVSISTAGSVGKVERGQSRASKMIGRERGQG
jgi:hypothetical protein